MSKKSKSRERSLQERLDIYLFNLYTDNELFYGIDEKLKSLFLECDNEDDIALLEHLLSNFNYLSQVQVGFALQSIATQVISAANGKRCALVATAIGDEPDSSQSITQMIKVCFSNYDNIEIFNNMIAYLKKMDKFELCYLIDDFSGTGRTLESRIRSISNEIKQKNLNVEVGVFLIAAMEKAAAYLQEKIPDIVIIKLIKAGISGYFSDDELKKYTTVMERMESKLALQYKGKYLPFFGYDRAEALYAIQNMNIPNSTFPIFWWPLDANEKIRTTCFIRANP